MQQPDLFVLLLAAGTVLILATAIGHFLMTRTRDDQTSNLVETFNAYVISWWGMTVLLGIGSLGGRVGVIILFAFCSFAAMREFLTLTTKNRDDHWVLASAFFAILPIQYLLVGLGWYGMYSIFIPVYVFLFLPILAAMRGNTQEFLVRVSETQWALMITIYCGSHIPALLDLNIPGFEGRNILLIAFLIVVAQASDFSHYLWAKLYGKTKIAPKVENSRTWEGCIGAMITAVAVGGFLWWLTPFSIFAAAALAAVISLTGFFGNIVMAAIKRDRGVRDWGALIPGHGGFIDRLGSVLFTAPVFFHVVRYFWALY